MCLKELRLTALAFATPLKQKGKAPVITIFDHRGCQRGGPNKEYSGPQSGDQVPSAQSWPLLRVACPLHLIIHVPPSLPFPGTHGSTTRVSTRKHTSASIYFCIQYTAVDANSLAVLVPSPQDDEMCVKVQSVDIKANANAFVSL